jgi:1,4-alpha-glucan branching enzyme
MVDIERALKNLQQIDPQLVPYFEDIRLHLERYKQCKQKITKKMSLMHFAEAHLYFGVHKLCEDAWVVREWLPNADAVWLYGDFNNWNPYSHPMKHIGGGVWEIRLYGKNALRHGQFIKLMVGRQGISFERIPAYIRRAVMDERDHRLCGQIWCPNEQFVWSDADW